MDEKKQIFTSEKFLLMASEDGEFTWDLSVHLQRESFPDHLFGPSALPKPRLSNQINSFDCGWNKFIPVGSVRLRKWGTSVNCGDIVAVLVELGY